MRKRKISVPLTPEGIQHAIAELILEKNIIEQKKKDLLQELSKVGIETADRNYKSTTMVYDIITLKNGYRVKFYAKGHHVCFLEFGAGLTTDTGHPLAQNVNKFVVSQGTWSATLGKNEFNEWGYWMWGWVKMDHVPPRRGMLAADIEVQKQFRSIVGKVFC